MAPVANHPVKRKELVIVNWPLIGAESIIRTITSTATAPLVTADQNSVWIGLNEVKFNATPTKEAIIKDATIMAQDLAN